MAIINIKTNFKDVQKSLDKLNSNLQQKVVPAALNKVVAKANTTMIREITAEFNIKSNEVRSNLRVIRAQRDFSKWYAKLDPFAKNKKGRGLNLIRFTENKVSLAEGRRRAKSGTQQDLRFQIKRGAGKKTIKGAFIGNKGRTVFARTGKERLPIKALTTIDVPQMFNTRRINKKVIARINSEMSVEFDRAIKAALLGTFK
jgi:hypothetical protein